MIQTGRSQILSCQRFRVFHCLSSIRCTSWWDVPDSDRMSGPKSPNSCFKPFCRTNFLMSKGFQLKRSTPFFTQHWKRTKMFPFAGPAFRTRQACRKDVDISSVYNWEHRKELGSGSFGQVYAVKHRCSANRRRRQGEGWFVKQQKGIYSGIGRMMLSLHNTVYVWLCMYVFMYIYIYYMTWHEMTLCCIMLCHVTLFWRTCVFDINIIDWHSQNGVLTFYLTQTLQNTWGFHSKKLVAIKWRPQFVRKDQNMDYR